MNETVEPRPYDELTKTECSRLVGEIAPGEYLACAAPTVPGSIYCLTHRQEALRTCE